MKKALVFLAFVFLTVSCSERRIQSFGIRSYNIQAVFDNTTGDLLFKTLIQLSTLADKQKLNLLFTSSAIISKIEFIENNKSIPVSYKLFKDTLKLEIPQQLKGKENLSLSVEYKLPSDKYKTGDVIYLSGSRWCPILNNQFSVLNLEVTTSGFMAFADGELDGSLTGITTKDNITKFKWHNAQCLKPVLLITPGNYYAHTKIIDEGKELNFHFSTRDTTLTNKFTERFMETFRFFNSFIGPYKPHQLNFYELPGNEKTIYYSSTVIMATTKAIKEAATAVDEAWCPLEIAHQWFGNGIGFAAETRLRWYMEVSLSDYSRIMYFEKKFGKDSLQKALIEYKKVFRDLFLDSRFDIPISSPTQVWGRYTFDGPPHYLDRFPLADSGNFTTYSKFDEAVIMDRPNIAVFFKGPLVFHYVRQQIGKENFVNFLRTLYSKYYGKVIDYEEFKTELSKYDKSGKVIKRMEELTNMKGVLPI